MAQLLKGKDIGASALSAWLTAAAPEVGHGIEGWGSHKHPNTEWLCVLCWAQVRSSQGSPGQLHLAPFSSGSEDNIHSGTQDQRFQGGWRTME